MARKQNAGSEPPVRGWRTGLRYAAYSLGALALVVLALFVYARVEQFLAEDARFRLAEPLEPGAGSPALRIEGAHHIPVGRIGEVFAADYGRSVFLLPLQERRQSLKSIAWVKDATVSRLWPDRVAVRITERQPVAFLQLPGPGGAAGETALIDGEGVILELPPRAGFALPVLTGIRREHDLSARRQRVAAAVRLLHEAAEYAGQFSEIDVSDPDNLRVTQAVDGQAVALLLGNANFHSRLRNFLDHFPEIRRRLPNAMHFDLRIDDRITAAGKGGRGG